MAINPNDLATKMKTKLTQGGYSLVGDPSFKVTVVPGTDKEDGSIDGYFSTASGLLGVQIVRLTNMVNDVELEIHQPTLFCMENRYWIALPSTDKRCTVYAVVAFPDLIFAGTPKYRGDIIYPITKTMPVVITNTVLQTRQA